MDAKTNLESILTARQHLLDFFSLPDRLLGPEAAPGGTAATAMPPAPFFLPPPPQGPSSGPVTAEISCRGTRIESNADINQALQAMRADMDRLDRQQLKRIVNTWNVGVKQ
jgi:hypothetical protein